MDLDEYRRRIEADKCVTCAGSGIFGGRGSYYDAPGRGKPCPDCGGSGLNRPGKSTDKPSRYSVQQIMDRRDSRTRIPKSTETGEG